MKKNVREKRRLESKRMGCKCEACIECCERDPGWFMPDEIAKAAGLKGMSEAEFVKQFCVEHVLGDATVITPAQKPGKKSCIFLFKDKLCGIHEEKPFECKKVFACKSDRRHQKIRESIAKTWGK